MTEPGTEEGHEKVRLFLCRLSASALTPQGRDRPEGHDMVDFLPRRARPRLDLQVSSGYVQELSESVMVCIA